MEEIKTIVILTRTQLKFDSPIEINEKNLSEWVDKGYQVKSVSSHVIQATPYTGESDEDGVRPQDIMISTTYLLSKSAGE